MDQVTRPRFLHLPLPAPDVLAAYAAAGDPWETDLLVEHAAARGLVPLDWIERVAMRPGVPDAPTVDRQALRLCLGHVERIATAERLVRDACAAAGQEERYGGVISLKNLFSLNFHGDQSLDSARLVPSKIMSEHQINDGEEGWEWPEESQQLAASWSATVDRGGSPHVHLLAMAAIQGPEWMRAVYKLGLAPICSRAWFRGENRLIWCVAIPEGPGYVWPWLETRVVAATAST